MPCLTRCRRIRAKQVFHEYAALSIVCWQNEMPTMTINCRFFLCVGCCKQVLICSYCDHGQRYCSNECSKSARTRSLRAANTRYQQSLRGRIRHAERTRRYRLKKNKVTYQGSLPACSNDLLTEKPEPESQLEGVPSQPSHESTHQCHFCGVICSEFVRYNFLQRNRASTFVKPNRRGTQHGQSP